jgi:hypothetical protein
MYEFMIGKGCPDQASVLKRTTYWGDQPIRGCTAYIGVVVFFLGILAYL